jgi:hypothetical protein
MDGHAGKRPSSVRRQWLSIEPLEDRFLLAALNLPVGPYVSPSASAQASTLASQPIIGPVVARPVGSSTKPSQPASDDYATAATNNSSGESDREYATATSNGPPAVHATSATSRPAHDHDHDYRDDDDHDGRDIRRYQMVSETRATIAPAEEAAGDRADYQAAASRLESVGQPDENPPTTQMVRAVAPALGNVARSGTPPVATPHVDEGDIPAAGLTTIAPPRITSERPSVQLANAVVVADVSEDTQPPAGLPSAGEIGLNLHLVEHGLESFFARLTGPVEDGYWGGSAASISSWLAGVAAAALQIARVRDKARRPSLSPDGLPPQSVVSAGA